MTLCLAHYFPTSELASLSLNLLLLSRPFKWPFWEPFVKVSWKVVQWRILTITQSSKSWSMSPGAYLRNHIYMWGFVIQSRCQIKFFGVLGIFQLHFTKIRQLAPPCLSSSICCMQKAVEPANEFSWRFIFRSFAEFYWVLLKCIDMSQIL